MASGTGEFHPFGQGLVLCFCGCGSAARHPFLIQVRARAVQPIMRGYPSDFLKMFEAEPGGETPGQRRLAQFKAAGLTNI